MRSFILGFLLLSAAMSIGCVGGGTHLSVIRSDGEEGLPAGEDDSSENSGEQPTGIPAGTPSVIPSFINNAGGSGLTASESFQSFGSLSFVSQQYARSSHYHSVGITADIGRKKVISQ